jgi:Zn finger protein HypA/HybF involved in hydrogenase expression
MHESSLIKDMLATVSQVQKEQQEKRVKKIAVELSEFGALNEEHFRFHFDEETKGTAWQGVGLEIRKVPFGIDAKLVSVTFGE